MHRRIILMTLALGACNPKAFEDYPDTAPIRVGAAPGGFEGPRYGQVIATVSGKLDGADVSRVVASGGGNSPLVFTRSYDDGKLSEQTFLRCKDKMECSGANDIGATLIPFARWGGKTAQARSICVFAPANSLMVAGQGESRLGGDGYVACELPSNKPQSFTLGPALTDARDNGLLQFSGFGLPEGHPLGVAVYGAYTLEPRTSAPRNGGLYAQPDMFFEERVQVPPSTPIPLVDPSTGKAFSADPEAGDFGRQVVGAVDGENLVIAISQPSQQRVIVASYDASATGDVTSRVRVHACIPAPDGSPKGFGERLAIGDLTGDGAPELVIGNDPLNGADIGKQGLYVFDGAGLPGVADGEGCPGWQSAGMKVPCADESGIRCDDSGFGGSLAIGDIDGDKRGDLIVGAPFASVGGAKEAGAVWIFPGSSDGLDTSRTTVITVPTEAKARFGWSVAALHTKDRDEPVASAPGVSKLFTVMCTPLEEGFGGEDLCL